MEVGSNSKYSSEPSLVVNGVRATSEIGIFSDVTVGPFLRMIGAPPTITRQSASPGTTGKARLVHRRGGVFYPGDHRGSSRGGDWLRLWNAGELRVLQQGNTAFHWVKK